MSNELLVSPLCNGKNKWCGSIGSSVSQVLQNVQKLIEEQQLEHYSNIRGWARVLGDRVETILTHRLHKLVEEWVSQFEDWPNKGTALIQNGIVLEIQVSFLDEEGSITSGVTLPFCHVRKFTLG